MLHIAQPFPLPAHPQPPLPPSSVLWGISPSMFLLRRDHTMSRYLLLSACGVFSVLSLPEGIDVLKGLMEEMSCEPAELMSVTWLPVI